MRFVALIAVGGLLTLLAVGLATAYIFAVASVAWEALHPRRRTVSWALATGGPADPDALARPRPALRSGADPAPSRALGAPPTAPSWRLVDHRAPDGTSLPAWELDGDDPAGPVTIIVHGWGRSRWDSLRRAPLFLPFSSRLILPDLRGHGEAGGSTRLGAVEVADVAALAEGVATPGAPLLLVGHSMGAGIVIRAAVALAERRRVAAARVVGVVALAPYERVATPIAARLEQRALPSSIIAAPAVLLLRLLGVRERPLSESASRITVPLLVATAAADPISPANDGRRIAAAAPPALGRFTALPGGDHADPGAADPQAFERALNDFVTECWTSLPRASGEAG